MFITGVWESLYGWKEFLLVVAVLTIVAAILCPIIVNRFEYKRGKMPFLYFMFERSTRELAYICFVLIESIFVLSCVLFQYKTNAGVILMLSMIGIMIIILGMHWKLIIMEVCSTLFFSLFLLFAELMLSYNKEIKVDATVTILYILVCIAILAYIAFYILWHMLFLRNSSELRRIKTSGENNEIQDEEQMEKEKEQ